MDPNRSNRSPKNTRRSERNKKTTIGEDADSYLLDDNRNVGVDREPEQESKQFFDVFMNAMPRWDSRNNQGRFEMDFGYRERLTIVYVHPKVVVKVLHSPLLFFSCFALPKIGFIRLWFN
ncbi:hypothetical protein GWI33_017076 [Rhynchophorus ferrugineus]|uniref:Uncharacterized protein n=1 Tax=Rhynchophorus ferrugineus TaxID=354439 RepID=A0A834HWP6_RHYFE|nr:hypothetical protein GWI33_017076 [Rhynchophorus ferrugineus]